MNTTRSVKADSQRKSGSALHLWVISGILLLYSYQTFMQGGLTGNQHAQRGTVYALIVLLMMLMAFPVFLGPPLPSGTVISRTLWALFAWILLVDLVRGTDQWLMATRVGLAFWWSVTYVFMARLGLRNPRARELLPRIMVFFFVFFCIMTVAAVILIEQRTGHEQGVAGAAYYALSASPFIFLLEGSAVVRFGLIVLGILAVGFSSKRGAIVSMVAMFCTVGFVYLRAGRLRIKKLFALLAVLCFAVVIFWYLQRLTDGYLLSRFTREELSDGSGRADIWRETIEAIKEGSTQRMLIGGGSGSTIDLVGTGTHNEWLEFQNCYGVVGVLLLAVLLGAMGTTAYRYYRSGNSDRAAAAFAAFTLSLAQTLFSALYIVHSFLYIAATFGFLRGLELLDRQKITNGPAAADLSASSRVRDYRQRPSSTRSKEHVFNKE